MTEDLMGTDQEILRSLARHLRRHELGCFDDDGIDQNRAEQLIAWFADNVDAVAAVEFTVNSPWRGPIEIVQQ